MKTLNELIYTAKSLQDQGVLIAHRPTVAVDEILHVYTNCTGALIQDGKLGPVVKQSGHLHTHTKKEGGGHSVNMDQVMSCHTASGQMLNQSSMSGMQTGSR